MSELFLEQKPSWMYQDPAHYSAPYATSLIGAKVAKSLITLKNSKIDKLAATQKKLMKSSRFSNIDSIYISADKLESSTSGPVENKNANNNLMQFDYLRMHPNSKLNLNADMFPLALFVRSDSNHNAFEMNLVTESGLSVNASIGSRHLDTNGHRFIYTSIPLPLLWGQKLITSFSPTAFTLAILPECQPAENTASFDCFYPGSKDSREHYLDLIGILFVVQK